MSLIKTKSVSFNVENLEQRELLEWSLIQRKMGFSEYVKALIAQDMKLRKVAAQRVNTPTQKTPSAQGAITPRT